MVINTRALNGKLAFGLFRMVNDRHREHGLHDRWIIYYFTPSYRRTSPHKNKTLVRTSPHKNEALATISNKIMNMS